MIQAETNNQYAYFGRGVANFQLENSQQAKVDLDKSISLDSSIAYAYLVRGMTHHVSPLPGMEKEAKAIAEIFKTQPLIGNAATETAIVQKMPQAKIIHLATNVVSSNCQKQGSPDVIALASSTTDDDWLSTEEIQSLNLKADLVVLSSCDTALGKITGDGVIGLSRAFFSAGANSVIGSLWDVSDTSTVTLMTEFHSNLSKKPDKAGALRQAMLATMKKYPNPSDWAAFTLIGLL